MRCLDGRWLTVSLFSAFGASQATTFGAGGFPAETFRPVAHYEFSSFLLKIIHHLTLAYKDTFPY